MAKLYLLLVFAGLGISSNALMEGMIEKHIETCQKEMNKTHEEVKKIIDGAANNNYSQEAGCFIKCVGEKVGLMDANGKLIMDKFKELGKLVIPEGPDAAITLRKNVDHAKGCLEIDEGNGCDNARKLVSCLHQTVHHAPKK